MSPLQRTHERLREHGYEVAKTEHWNWKAKVRQDLFGLIDTLAIHPESEHDMLAIQCTDDAHLAQHRKKILTHRIVPVWIRHARLELWSWGMKGKVGRRKLWTLHRERFHLHNGQVTSFEVTEKVV